MLIRDKSDAYVQSVIPEIIQLVTEDDRCPSVLKDLMVFDTLRFKDRDELEQVISSYCNVHEFDAEKAWDQRLRHHYKERYDHRKNMIDWDFNMYAKGLMPYLQAAQWKQWRTSGLAFEWRLTDNKQPNRTFSGYLPAYQVSEPFLTRLE